MATQSSGAIVAPAVLQAQAATDIVGFNLQNNQSSALAQHYITFQQVFLPGKVKVGTNLVATVNGQKIPVQMDVKTTNADGSVRMAILTLQQPAMAANSSLSLMLGTTATASTASAVSLANLNSSNYNLGVTIAVHGGKTVTLDAATVLKQALANGTVSYWENGPLATQARVDVPISGSLHVTLDITAFADGTTSTDVQFNNDYAMQASGGTVVYDATISQSGKTVLQQSNITQYQYQTWHQTVTSNGAAQVNIVHDVNYLEKTGAVPNYDLSAGVSASTLASESVTGTQILGSASVTQYMPTTGGRADIGPMPSWNAVWLVTQSQQAAQFALAQADAAGSVPWHFYDPTTKAYVDLNKYPTLWADSRGSPTLTQQPSDSTGWTPDAAHQPDLSYVAYLMTGNRYYLDQLNAQATYDELSVWPDPRQNGLGLVANGYDQVRQQAWSLRQIDEAAWANPDGSVEKANFTQLANNNWKWLVSQIPAWTKLEGQAYGYVPGNYGDGSGAEMAPWQQDYFASTTIQAALNGNADALTFLKWEANFLVGRFLSSANGFNPHDGAAYNLTVGNGSGGTYTTWAQIEQATIANGDSNGTGWADGDYAELASQTLAGIITATGSADAIKAYNWLMGAGAPQISPYADPQLDIVPRTGASTTTTGTTSTGSTSTGTTTTGSTTTGSTTTGSTTTGSTTTGSTTTGSTTTGSTTTGSTTTGSTTTGSTTTGSTTTGSTTTGSTTTGSTTTGSTTTGSTTTTATGTILHVGLGQKYTTLASAVAAAKNGDTIQVQAGTYVNDFSTITKNITIQGIGGMVTLLATTAPSNGKGILDVSGNVSISNFAFTGAKVPDGNGAGIRYESGNLTLTNDYFYSNQNGLLAAADPTGSITISKSEFANNGSGDGHTHNLYVGEVGKLTVDQSYFTGAIVGHEIKSRADVTVITNNRIQDGPSGTGSYDIDLPNGGKATIQNNVIEKGPKASNPAIISFGEEGGIYAGSSLVVSSNTILNDLTSPSSKAVVNTSTATASITNNKVYGLTASQISSGPAQVTGTTYLTTEPALNTSAPWTTTTSTGTTTTTTPTGTTTTPTTPATSTGTTTTTPTTTAVAPNSTVTTKAATSTTVTLSSGNNTVNSNGNDTINAGSGSDTISAGAGNVIVNGGKGSLQFVGGSGAALIKLQAGTTNNLLLYGDTTVNMAGSTTVDDGGSSAPGTDIHNFIKGMGGNAIIKNFGVGSDFLHLTGFAANAVQQVVGSAQQGASGTMLKLPDGAGITLVGVSGVSANFFN